MPTRHLPPLSSKLLLITALVMAFARLAPGLSPDRGLTQSLRRIWQSQQGLPDPTLYCVRQLGEGYLYLGTQTGLARFDGMRFTKIDPVGNAWVQDVVEDEAGNLWIATNGRGVIALRKGKATEYGGAAGLPSENVRQLLVDGKGVLWACTTEGLARFEGGKFVVISTVDRIGSNDVMAVCAGGDGKIWVGGRGGRVAVWDGKGFVGDALASVGEPVAVHAILRGEDGAMWIGTTGGLVQLKEGHERLFTTAEGLADNWIFSLTQGTNGAIWVGTRNGFSRVRNSGGAIESFQAQDGLSQSTVYSVCEDREGSVWVGTKHGLNQFWDGRVIPFTMSEGLPSNDAGPVCDDGAGGTWVGTFGAGLSRYDGHGFRTLTTGEGLASNTILSLAAGEKGELWVGTDKGVNRLRDGKVERTYRMSDGLPAESVRELFRDNEGALWVGTSAGAAVLRGERFVTAAGTERFAHSAITGFAERDGELLVASEGTVLYGYKEGRVREVARDEMVRGVDALYRDGEGLMWMGTSGGGMRLLDGGKLTTFTVKDGLFDDEIYGIVGDGEDRLWMACSKGIFFVTRSDLRNMATGKLQHFASTPFSPTEGLRTIECKSGVQPAAWRMGDGRLWFSTIHGVIVIDPKHLQRATGVAPAVIEDVIVNGHRELPPWADQIGTLSAGLKNLEFRYTALSFIAPVRLSFRYQLEGFDKEWVDAESRREAFYTNLPPGEFKFRVQARNIEGPWSEAATPVAFTLAPYFYQRWWFWPLCAAAAGAAGWTAYRLRIRAIKGRLNAIVAERSRIARELHDTLLQGFSGVTMEMQALSSRLPASAERGTLVEIIRDAANCMKEARRSVAGLRRGRSEGGGLAAAVGEAARQLTETRDVQLRLDVEEELPLLGVEVEYNLVRIMQEAVTNAVKHSGARVIEVSLKRVEEGLRLVVRDDGKGFEFGHVEGGNGAGGHYGIVGMRERAGQIGGRLDVETGVGRGTVVSVVLGGGESRRREDVAVS